jgi:hypothetical protein
MGDYHSIRKADGSTEQLCKVGTMDDWRYVRRSEVEKMAEIDAGDGANMQMAMAHGNLMYRFPWPDEDEYEHNLDHINTRDMFRTYTVPVPQEVLDVFDHDVRWVPIGAANQGGAFNVNVAVPCPTSEAFRKLGLKNSGVQSPILQVIGERVSNGWARTIFGCGYCEKMFSLPEGPELDLVRLIVRTWTTRDRAWWEQVADRFRPRP